MRFKSRAGKRIIKMTKEIIRMVTWNFKRGAWTSTMSPSPSKNTIPLKRSAASSCGREGNGGIGVCVDEDEGVCVDTGDGRRKGREQGRGRRMVF